MKEIWAKGSRKTSVARVRISSGKGDIKINGKTLEEYVDVPRMVNDVKKPLELTETLNKFDILVNVDGGGITGQAEAIRHGIARALVKKDESYKSILKSNGLLKRDPRMVERKKYGQKKARKSFQFSKR